MYTIQQALTQIVNKQNLTTEQMTQIMHLIMQGQASPVQLSAFLIGMRMKGETVEELTAALKVARELVIPVPIKGEHVIDIVGTGGDQAQLFNISTTAAFVVAAAGAQVAKHGNRSVSSASGSADVLEAAGLNLNHTPEQVAEAVNALGIGFMFAPAHHTAMKHSLPVRRELGIRTFFNLLGPLSNPANASHYLMGVFDAYWLQPVAEVLKSLETKRALIVHSEDGLDEISVAAKTSVVELNAGKITSYTLSPEQLGIKLKSLKPLKVNNAQESLTILKQVLQNEKGVARDMVILNAGAAIYAANLSNSIEEGVKKAEEVINSGAALQKFKLLIEWSKTNG